MSVPFYADHHVNAAITEGLRRRGVDVLTCAEDGADQADDNLILERATQLGRTVFLELIAKVLTPAEMKNRIEFLPY